MGISVLTLTNVILMSVTIARSQRHDSGACYRLYIPPQSGFPRARCLQPIGGNPTTKGVFTRNDKACCRAAHASGWGSENNCRSCSSIRGSLYPWGEWSSCSRTCGWGEQRRHRVCSNAVCAGVRGRRKTESRACLWKACCPVDGNWADWSSWTECSTTCGQGLQYRTRSCSSPSPSCGGKPCRSYPRQMQRCQVGQCSSWSSWTTAGPCSVTCGIGNMRRTRTCHSPLGDTCSGEPVEYLPCDEGSCAVDGGWCTWSLWSTCTSTCQHVIGTRKRNRLCECPFPHNGGRQCSGSDGDVEDCSSDVNCLVNGNWSDWSSWGECSSEKCATSPGIRLRTRTCNNPPPKFGGKCEGRSAEEKKCININGCDVEGVYGEWSQWSPCTSTCGSCSFRMRDRQCVHRISVPDTELVGTPNFYCTESKVKDKERCELEACSDGSDSCDGDYDYSSSGEESPLRVSPYDDDETDDYGDLGFSDNDLNHDMAEILDKIRMEEELGDSKTHPTAGSFLQPVGLSSWLNEYVNDAQELKEFKLEEPTVEYSGSEEYDVHEYEDDPGSGINDNDEHDLDCELLDNVTGEDAPRAAGCCDLLKGGLTNATDPGRLQECFSLHYDYVVARDGEADTIVDPLGRSTIPSCRYRKKPDYLRTICCLWKSCSNWKRKGLRNQCTACRDGNYCQSCDIIILSA